MSEGQILVNTDAMETTLNLLTEASTKLSLARDYYNSDKLSGTGLVTNCKEAIDEITKAVSAASGVLGEINVDFGNLDAFETTSETTPETSQIEQGAYISVNGQNTAGWTEETIDEYEADINNRIEILELTCEELSNDIKEKESVLAYFFVMSGNYEVEKIILGSGYPAYNGFYYTPEQYAAYLWSTLDNNQFLNEDGTVNVDKQEEYVQEEVEKYTNVLNEAFSLVNGKTYTEYLEDLEYEKGILSGLRASKYTLQQQKKEIPYLRISITDEYKAFAENHESYATEPILITDALKYYMDENGKKIPCATFEQYTMFLYLSANEGEDSAKKYLDAIEDSLNQSEGLREAETVIKQYIDEDGNVDFDAVAGIWFEGFGDGIVNFQEGLKRCLDFSGEGYKTATDYKQMYLMQALEEGDFDLLSFSYQNGVSIGNMAIPMAVSFIPGCGAAGSVLMGFSAGGNAKNQALVEGYSIVQAYIYGTANGLSEVAMERLLGCIPGISKSTSGNFLVKMLNEGKEEFIQTWFDAGLRSLILQEEINLDDTSQEAITSFIMGAITSAELNGVSAFAQSTIKFVYNGYHVELALSELTEYIEGHPDMKVSDAIQVFYEATVQGVIFNDETVKSNAVDQNALNSIFTDGYQLTVEGRRKLLDFLNQHVEEIYEYMITDLELTPHNAEVNIETVKKKLENPDTFFVSKFLGDTVYFDICKKLGLTLDIEATDIWLKLSDDAYSTNMRENVITFMNERGVSTKDTTRAFMHYNTGSGSGLCSFGATAEVIFYQLSDESFRKRFGYDKNVNQEGKTYSNSVILADMIFERNKSGNSRKPDFVLMPNGSYAWCPDGSSNLNYLRRLFEWNRY